MVSASLKASVRAKVRQKGWIPGFQVPFPCPKWTRGFSFERVAMSGQTMSLVLLVIISIGSVYNGHIPGTRCCAMGTHHKLILTFVEGNEKDDW